MRVVLPVHFLRKLVCLCCMALVFAKAGAQVGILSFSPASGNIGSTLTITGFGFNSIPGNNIVRIGSVRATVISSSYTSLVVKVPAGADLRPITVTNEGFTAYSANAFIVTFPGGLPAFTRTMFGDTISLQTPFAVATTYSAKSETVFADLDDDGKVDMAIANDNPALISIFKNRSQLQQINMDNVLNLAVPGHLCALAAGDLDGDGKIDLAGIDSTGPQNNIAIYQNTSTTDSIAFGPKLDISVAKPDQLVIADFDGDGMPDILIRQAVDSLNGETPFQVLQNTSTGCVISFSPVHDLTVFSNASKMVCTDLNGDGLPDLAYIDPSTYETAVYVNTSANNIISFDIGATLSTGQPERGMPSDIFATDMDGDHLPDLIVSYKNGSVEDALLRPAIYRNLSNRGTLNFAPEYMPNGSIPTSPTKFITVADVDGDGKPDLITDLARFSGYKNNSTTGNLDFGYRYDWPTNISSYGHTGIINADLDGDGKPDLLLTGLEENKIAILRNKTGEAVSGCIDGNAVFATHVSGSSYQWQVDAGAGFTDIINDTFYTGATSNILQISNAPYSWLGYKYRCIVDGNAGIVYTLTFTNYWTGAVSTAWEEPGNWSCGTVPGINSDVVILSGSVVVNASTAIKSLTINPLVNFTLVPGVDFGIGQ